MIGQIYNSFGKALYYCSILPLRIYLGRTKRVYGLILCGGEVLLIKNWFSRQDWRLPGGGIHKNESPEVALARECQEELGITLDPKDFYKITEGNWSPDKANFNYQIFALKLKLKPRLHPQKLEIISTTWYHRSQQKYNLPVEIEKAIQEVKLV